MVGARGVVVVILAWHLALATGSGAEPASTKPAPARSTSSASSSASKPVSADEAKAAERDLARASTLAKQLPVSEWLGPLAPVALSPFFGITCLSGLALYGPDWLPKNNAILGDGSLLKQPLVFWTFLVLTIVTSLPRLSKVSKPLAQLSDQLEAYSGVVTMLVVRFFTSAVSPEPEVAALAQSAIVELGFVSMSWDALLMVASAVNILVINAIKFFCELVVWLIPIPFIDAMFEAANKTLCAALVALYAYNPMLALAVDLALLAGCSLLLWWIGRSLNYWRTLLLDPVYAFVWPSYGRPGRQGVLVFPEAAIGSIGRRVPCWLVRTPAGWVLRRASGWFKTVETEWMAGSSGATLTPGWLANTIAPVDGSAAAPKLTLSRRYQSSLNEVAEHCQVTLPSAAAPQPA